MVGFRLLKEFPLAMLAARILHTDPSDTDRSWMHTKATPICHTFIPKFAKQPTIRVNKFLVAGYYGHVNKPKPNLFLIHDSAKNMPEKNIRVTTKIHFFFQTTTNLLSEADEG